MIVVLLLCGLVFTLVTDRDAGAQSSSWAPSVAPSSTTVRPGDAVDLVVSLTPPTNDTILLDVEVYDANWRKVHQMWWDGEPVRAGETRTFSTRWQTPANLPNGTYQVMLGVFDPGWRGLLGWNLSGARLRVSNSAPASTVPATIPPTTATPTTVAPTTVPATAPPTTPPATVPPTTVRPTTTTAAPTTSAPPQGDTFTEDFSSGTDGWWLAHWRNEAPGNGDAPTSAVASGGRLVVTSADQNYGDALVHAGQMYDVSGGGVIAWSMDPLPGTDRLVGAGFVQLAPAPSAAPSISVDNGNGGTIADGVRLDLSVGCRVSWSAGRVFRYVDHAETFTEPACPAPFDNGDGRLAALGTRYELRVNPAGNAVLWSDSGGSMRRLFDVGPIPTVGFLSLGVHNHASAKYANGQPSVEVWFDDVSFPAGAAVRTYPGGQGVDLDGATRAWVVANVYRAGGTVTVNGATTRVAVQDPSSHSDAIAVEVPISQLRDGANSLTVAGQAVANVALVLTS